MPAAAPAGVGEEAPAEANDSAAAFSLDTGWRLHPQVAVRPEPFGALLYHFHTRKLSFLKSPAMVAVIKALDTQPTARAACLEAGVDINEPQVARLYVHALGRLAETKMIVPR
ncbi:mycofactocin biosynthesis chaperone MftB [Dietzia sp.]|uniref:mycofactocin biosynthesis chaperone MftB n=1 Tax=Dietzia sp. TaxID=1871616 RepID=UPI002FD8CA18